MSDYHDKLLERKDFADAEYREYNEFDPNHIPMVRIVMSYKLKRYNAWLDPRFIEDIAEPGIIGDNLVEKLKELIKEE